MLFTKSLLLVAAAVTFAGASSARAAFTVPSAIAGAQISHAYDPATGHLMLSVSTQVSAANVYLTPVSAPIYNPKNKLQIIGQLSVQADITGQNYFVNALIDISVGTTAVKAGYGMLPNGLMIPIGGVEFSNWIDLPIQSVGHVYLNVNPSTKVAIAGVSMTVAGMKTGFPFSVMVPFNKGGVQGMAGLFTGMSKNTSGFSVFVDASSLYKKLN